MSRDRHGRFTKPPDTFLTLNRMADYLSARFDREIADTTPYWWWKTDKGGNLPVKMPEPAQIHGQSPMWIPADIDAWYQEYLEAIGEPYDVVLVKSRQQRR